MEKHAILNDAQDFIVFEKKDGDNYVYAAKPSLDVMRQFYEQSIANPNDREIPAFQQHYWEFDETEGIRGSNAFLALRLDRQTLRPLGLWIPSLLEAKALESQGKLENGVYRDYGFVVYDRNSEIDLVQQGNQLNLQLPLIVPFRALDYNVQEKYPKPSLVKSPMGIISGEKASKEIDSLDYNNGLSDYKRTNWAFYGINRLFRRSLGDWGADWDLYNSNSAGRVDWVCGEASRTDLEEAIESLMKREFSEKIRDLETQRKERRDFLLASLNTSV